MYQKKTKQKDYQHLIRLHLFRLFGVFKDLWIPQIYKARKEKKKDKGKEQNWLDAGPAVGPHLQKPAGSHTQPDASSITQQYVEYHLIPPALRKVWQQVHEEQLWEKKVERREEIKFIYVVKEIFF